VIGDINQVVGAVFARRVVLMEEVIIYQPLQEVVIIIVAIVLDQEV
jgi:hypothetical protein